MKLYTKGFVKELLAMLLVIFFLAIFPESKLPAVVLLLNVFLVVYLNKKEKMPSGISITILLLGFLFLPFWLGHKETQKDKVF